MEDNRLTTYLVIFLILALIVGGVIYLTFFKKEPVPPEPVSEEENEIQGQVEELDALHQQANPEPLSQEEMEEQIENLDALHKQAQPQSLSQEEIDRQLEELDRLHAQSQ